MTRAPEGHALLDLEMRRRLLATVASYPGLHVREAARQLGTSLALVEYHVGLLEEAGLVAVRRDDRYARLFAVQGPGPTEDERRVLGLLRAKLPLRITLYLLDRGESAKHGEVADALGLGKSKLSFHLRKLEAAGLVGRDDDGGLRVLQPKRVQRLLWTYQPTPDLREEFAKLWLGLYGDK
jgi:DNA-binding transcriptional ArsR family regulator